MSSVVIILAFFLCSAKSEETNQPSNRLSPRNYNHHAYEATKFLESLTKAKPTKQGPVLFPNNAPPQPRTPLIVTSRPLLEQINGQNFNPINHNNSIASPSFIQPNYLARFNLYKPISQPLSTPKPVILVNSVTGIPYDDNRYSSNSEYDHPYADVLKKSQLNNGFDRDNRYNDYEEQTILPPIYKALSDHAQQNVLKIQRNKQDRHNYQVKEPHFTNNYGDELNKNSPATSEENEHNKNYAFSYSVKDHDTGDDFSHSQQSSGSATNGEYRVRLPDGRMQIVSYTADENGYKADVRYDVDNIDNSPNSIDYSRNHDLYKSQIKENPFRLNDPYGSKSKDDLYRTNDPYRSQFNADQYRTNDPYRSQVKDDYHYTDLSKEYYNDDYSYEYGNARNEHKPKFNFDGRDNIDPKLGVIVVPNYNYQANGFSTVKPSYDELKPIFVTKKPNYYTKTPVEFNVPSTTSSSIYESPTTERVVIIGTSKSPLYTSIRNTLNTVSIPVTTPNPIYQYSVIPVEVSSTVNPLKNLNFSKNRTPVLSDSFISRINKYLTFK